MQFSRAAKEQSILCHGVVHASPGEYQSVVAAETGDHNRRSHQVSADRSEHLSQGGGGDSIFGGVLNSALQNSRPIRRTVQGKNIQINDVAGDVQGNYNSGPNDQ